MFAKPLSALRSKKGIAGAGILVTYGVYGLIAVAGQADTVMDNAVPVLEFLGTGPGVLLALFVAVILIVWAANTQEAEAVSASGAAPAAQQEREDSNAQKLPDTPESAEEWYDQPKITVTDATFERQPVTLDGYHYDRCTFRDCTFIYKGEKPFAITNFVLEGDNNIQAGSYGLDMFLRLLTLLKFIHPRIEMGEGLDLGGNVAYGYRLVKSTEPSKLGEEELKRYCLELADELYEFVEDYAWDDAARAEARDAGLQIEMARADIEAMHQYRRRFKRQVTNLITELKRRGWWKPEALNSEEWERLEKPDLPSDVQDIAECLETMGSRILDPTSTLKTGLTPARNNCQVYNGPTLWRDRLTSFSSTIPATRNTP